jgi:hypothetical protein
MHAGVRFELDLKFCTVKLQQSQKFVGDFIVLKVRFGFDLFLCWFLGFWEKGL